MNYRSQKRIESINKATQRTQSLKNGETAPGHLNAENSETVINKTL